MHQIKKNTNLETHVEKFKWLYKGPEPFML